MFKKNVLKFQDFEKCMEVAMTFKKVGVKVEIAQLKKGFEIVPATD